MKRLSAGRPVITSNHTPWNKLQDAEAGMNVAVDDLEELINAINFFVIMDGSVMEKWSRGAFDYAAREVDAEKIKEEYRGMVSSSSSKRP